MRVIIRFSIDSDPGSSLRNKLAGHLDASGFTRSGRTATWEALHCSPRDLRRTLSEFWRRVNRHSGPGQVDHFWMYSDRSDLDDILPE